MPSATRDDVAVIDDQGARADERPEVAPAELLAAVEGLRAELAAATFPLDVEGVGGARASRQDTLAQLDDYVLPRLHDLDAPLLAVVGGSTGAGKSTLVNSVVGRGVSASSVLRPTTRACVLVHHPDDAPWFTGPRILPHLARLSGEDAATTHAPDSVRLAQTTGLPAGVALLDAPDIDSVVEANRDLARQLLGAADLWLFVTTAARYADAVPWGFLRQAAQRGTSVAIVLDRVPPGAADEIGEHLAEMLVDEGLRHAPVFVVPETELVGGLLPLEHVADLREWLGRLGADARARGLLVRRTLSGALESLEGRVADLADASSAQVQTVEQLDAVVTAAYGRANEEVAAGMSDGRLLRGEVLARWQEYVGTGEFLKQIEVGFGRLRDRVVAAVQGRPAPVNDLGEALHSGVAELIVTHAERAQAEVRRRWEEIPGGRDLLAEHPELALPAPTLDADAARLVRDWQADILDLVRDEGKDRRAAARVLSLGVNAVGVVLMLVAFSYTMGSLGGAEVGIAGGSAVLAQRLLEAIFGDQAVRTLAAKARRRLAERTAELYETQAGRLTVAIADVAVRRDQPHDLLAAAARVRERR